MTEEQERLQLAELRRMADADIGAVSLLTYETMAKSKLAFAREVARLRIENAKLREALNERQADGSLVRPTGEYDGSP